MLVLSIRVPFILLLAGVAFLLLFAFGVLPHVTLGAACVAGVLGIVSIAPIPLPKPMCRWLKTRADRSREVHIQRDPRVRELP